MTVIELRNILQMLTKQGHGDKQVKLKIIDNRICEDLLTTYVEGSYIILSDESLKC